MLIPDDLPMGERQLEEANQAIGFLPIANFASPDNFVSACTPASSTTARSSFNNPAYTSSTTFSPSTTLGVIKSHRSFLRFLQDWVKYYRGMAKQNLIQPFDSELDWFKKGQHIMLLPSGSPPLNVLSHLGTSMTASMEKVLCQKIALAIRTMGCFRVWSLDCSYIQLRTTIFVKLY